MKLKNKIMVVNMVLRIFFVLSILSGLCNADLLEDWERAKEIAESRVEYYKVRQELFEGTDDASKEFQSGFFTENTRQIVTMGCRQSILSALIGGRGFGNGDIIDLKKRENLTFIGAWGGFLGMISEIKKSGNKEINRGSFEVNRSIYKTSASELGREERSASQSSTVEEDIKSLVDAATDYEKICNLLFPHLDSTKHRCDFNELKLHSSRQETIDSFQDDIDSLAAFIEGNDSKPKKPKKRKPKKKVTDSIQIGDTKLEATQPLSISVKPVTHSLQEVQSSAVEHSKGKSTLDASLMSSDPSTAEMDEEKEAFIFDYINYNQPRPEIKNPKYLRQLEKEAGMAQQEDPFEGEPEEAVLPPLNLKEKHLNTLKSIFKASAAHPPRWREALSALASVIKQRGGSICRSAGGSEVEFWVGKVRFLVDASHGGSDHDMMYPAQMTFLRKGLERAGVTLATLEIH